MKRIVAFVLVFASMLPFAFAVGNENSPQSNDPPGSGALSGSPLVGSWYRIVEGIHGNAGYYWSFGEDGRFAYLFSGYEPPHDGGVIESSVRERLMHGMYRVSGEAIECYEISGDDFFSWGDHWKYFPDRDPALLSRILLATPLTDSEFVEDFTFDFAFADTGTLRLVVDRDDFPDQYDMDFEYAG